MINGEILSISLQQNKIFVVFQSVSEFEFSKKHFFKVLVVRNPMERLVNHLLKFQSILYGMTFSLFLGFMLFRQNSRQTIQIFDFLEKVNQVLCCKN